MGGGLPSRCELGIVALRATAARNPAPQSTYTITVALTNGGLLTSFIDSSLPNRCLETRGRTVKTRCELGIVALRATAAFETELLRLCTITVALTNGGLLTSFIDSSLPNRCLETRGRTVKTRCELGIVALRATAARNTAPLSTYTITVAVTDGDLRHILR